ncbi:LolA-like outer membrane lipoprotein chaperone [Helicobacter saguini]|nr:LolA-like outer membrane lipoprotein chaperone [Helicobacter saguini]
MKIVRIFLIFISFMCLAWAAKDSKNTESWRNIKSLSADFKQEIKGERGAVSAIYSGKVYAADNKVKWEYTKPLPKEVYLQKDVAYVYEPNIKQVTIGTLSENVDFISILRQVTKIAENSYKTQIGEITYYLAIKDSKPYALKYKDNLENDISIIFSNVVLNAKIEPEVFIFNPPDDVEYIDAN